MRFEWTQCAEGLIAVRQTGIKLKTNDSDSHGDYTPTELFDILADVYT